MFENILQVVQNNQTLLTALGLGGAGVLTFWLKDVPKTFLTLVKRELTTSLTITSQNITFFDVLKWIGDNYSNKNFRELKLSNGKWGEDATSVLSVGYGVHFIRYNMHIFLLRLIKEEANQTIHDKETLILTKIGRSKKPFLDFITTVSSSIKNEKKTKIYKFDEDWEFIKEQNKRDLKTIYIEDEIKNALLKGLDSFIQKEDWYMNHGIPYQLGILLHGPPGTGKTSIIRAIASYLNYPLYILPTYKILKIEKAFENIQEKCIVVLEDIDCQTYTHSRESVDLEIVETNKKEEGSKRGDPMVAMGLAEILNALDGICSVGGRILIATTNYIEKLDAALIRSGRFDMKLKIGYVTLPILKSFLKVHFPEKQIPEGYCLGTTVTVALLQELILKNCTFEEILSQIAG